MHYTSRPFYEDPPPAATRPPEERVSKHLAVPVWGSFSFDLLCAHELERVQLDQRHTVTRSDGISLARNTVTSRCATPGTVSQDDAFIATIMRSNNKLLQMRAHLASQVEGQDVERRKNLGLQWRWRDVLCLQVLLKQRALH